MAKQGMPRHPCGAIDGSGVRRWERQVQPPRCGVRRPRSRNDVGARRQAGRARPASPGANAFRYSLLQAWLSMLTMLAFLGLSSTTSSPPKGISRRAARMRRRQHFPGSPNRPRRPKLGLPEARPESRGASRASCPEERLPLPAAPWSGAVVGPDLGGERASAACQGVRGESLDAVNQLLSSAVRSLKCSRERATLARRFTAPWRGRSC